MPSGTMKRKIEEIQPDSLEPDNDHDSDEIVESTMQIGTNSDAMHNIRMTTSVSFFSLLRVLVH